MLRPPDPRVRARILNFGAEGCGKSTGWLKIARWCADTGSDAQFYVLDTDDSAETMMAMGDYPEDRIHVWHAYEWEDYRKYEREVVPLLRPKTDWVVMDFVGNAWEAVQDWYIENTTGQAQEEYYMSVRQAGSQGLDGWKDWQFINKNYRAFINPLIYGNGAHVYMTAKATKIGDRDSREAKALYSGVGMRPEGQKALGFQALSVLYSYALRPNEPHMTTLKDLEGVKRLENQRINDFVIDYLVGAQRWGL